MRQMPGMPKKISTKETSPISKITEAKDFADLYRILENGDGIQGSQKKYSGAELKDLVVQVKNGTADLRSLTQREGLRDTVSRILANEGKTELQESIPQRPIKIVEKRPEISPIVLENIENRANFDQSVEAILSIKYSRNEVSRLAVYRAVADKIFSMSKGDKQKANDLKQQLIMSLREKIMSSLDDKFKLTDVEAQSFALYKAFFGEKHDEPERLDDYQSEQYAVAGRLETLKSEKERTEILLKKFEDLKQSRGFLQGMVNFNKVNKLSMDLRQSISVATGEKAGNAADFGGEGGHSSMYYTKEDLREADKLNHDELIIACKAKIVELDKKINMGAILKPFILGSVPYRSESVFQKASLKVRGIDRSEGIYNVDRELSGAINKRFETAKNN